ncbi:hybrid sensor histidine kinase/response regulator transcription factor [Larkinella rosea]|uniref:hybrid sensor histidine kinase/response regulator transcription factor n=1 Tax=Larkinella rosea TaxID=2025312 RepID=UPI00163AE74C|nr:hybrid sensor histidine kinase/response regulator transcription factor [Larkinella rosea]
MKTVLLLTGLFFCCSILANAQQFAASVKHYGPENGLSHREVNAIFQDRQGMMWFGTKFGLNRFDGKTFTTFTKERNGLDFDDIQSIAQDADGLLWLMGAHGQARMTLFNPLTGTAVSFEKKFNTYLSTSCLDVPQRVLGSANGTIFFSNCQPAILGSYSPDSGLRLVPLPQFKKLSVFRVTAHNTVWAVADANQLIEVATDGRILHRIQQPESALAPCFGQRNAGVEFVYFVPAAAIDPGDKNQVDHYYSVDELGNQHLLPRSVQQPQSKFLFPVYYPFDRTGLIWDGSRLWHPAKGVVLDVTSQLSGEAVTNRSFFCDQNGWLWLGTSFGVYQVKVTQNHFRRLFYDESNSGDNVAAIRGITTRGDQVYANLEKFGLFSTTLTGGSTRSLYGQPTFAGMTGLVDNGAGKLIAGIKGQLVFYDLRTHTYTLSKLPFNTIRKPVSDPNAVPEFPTNASVWTLAPYRNGQWIAGGRTGLWFVQATSGQLTAFTQYNQFPELAQAHVLHIAADRQGTIWLGSNAGLYVVDPAKGITARYWSGGKGGFYLPADNFQHFYQDAKGIYWLATANAGLIRWDRRNNHFRQFRRSEGLSNDNIYAVYPDRRGNLWMSSDYGIMRFDTVRQTARTYFVQDGITHNEFNRISHFQDKTGRIYFGGLNGITAFDPRDFEVEKPPILLPLRVVSFRQFDQNINQIVDKTADLNQTHQITLRPGDQTAVLDFAMLNFADAEKNVYTYQFKGLDNAWTHQAESSLRLGNLPYGTYQLLIKGQASNGQWSANTLTIPIEVLRPFYLQIWFIILTVLLLITGIRGWLRWRIWNHEQEQKRLQNEIRLATAQIEQDKGVIEQQAGMLQRLNETKSRFFANISHEFRTPLTVILGMTSELKRKQSEETGRREMDLIERNGTNLLRLINQILDLSKLEAGEMRLQPIRADLVRFCQYVAEPFHSLAAQKNSQLHVQSDVETLETDFDPDKLQDILSNLLSNALKFTSAGGRIEFRLTTQKNREYADNLTYYEAVSPTLHKNDSWIFLSVRDSGPGIETEQMPRIFNRFFQVDSPMPVSETGGTGIGLSLVQELVGLMNGGLAVRSRPGQGTEFIVQFRRTHQAPLAELPSAQPAIINRDQLEITSEPAGEKPVLLLVEDNEDVAAYIRSCLGETYYLLRAENGQAGINQAFEKIPDLILSDVMMPVQAGPQKDGFQLVDELKNDSRTSHIPIVLLTARAAVSDRLSGLRRGADAYLTKPFQRDELLIVLQNLLQSRRVLQAHYSQLALKTGPSAPEETASLEAVFLQKLRAAVEEQLDRTDLSIDEICQRLRMSRSTLHLKLVALTGLSTTRYIRALRLNKAKELLTSSDLNIAEVGYAVGFEDAKYFSRVFSEEFGVSPGQYRHSDPI